MYGILTTLLAGRGAQLTPVAAPIALIPLRSRTDAQFGRIATDHPCHAQYREILKRTVDEPFAMFVPA
jgi:hypothetical protein